MFSLCAISCPLPCCCRQLSGLFWTSADDHTARRRFGSSPLLRHPQRHCSSQSSPQTTRCTSSLFWCHGGHNKYLVAHDSPASIAPDVSGSFFYTSKDLVPLSKPWPLTLLKDSSLLAVSLCHRWSTARGNIWFC